VAVNPVSPFVRQAAGVTEGAFVRFEGGASVRASVGASVWASVWASVRASVWASVGDSVWASVGDSVRASVGASVRASVWASVRDSVRASVWAYVGFLFPNIKKWKHVDSAVVGYPFQAVVDLWRQGLVPSFDDKIWRIHGGENAETLWQGKLD